MNFIPRLGRIGPVLNWLAFTALVGAVLGAGSAILDSIHNGYFSESFRNLAGRSIQASVMKGTGFGLLTGLVGVIVFVAMWPVCRVIWRNWRSAALAAALGVPLLGILLVLAYFLNVEILPEFLSLTSVLGNLVLAGAIFLLWWTGTRWLLPRQSALGSVASSATLSLALGLGLAGLLAATVALARAWRVETPAGAPNVLIVLIDALRADRLGCYGYSRNTSPNIDEIARAGWRFDAAFAQSNWTKPSVAALITGLYPRQTSVSPDTWSHAGAQGEVLVDSLSPQHLTLAEFLGALGYETGAFGENHHLLRKLGFAQGYLTHEWREPMLTGSAFTKFTKKFRSGFTAEWISDHFVKWLGSTKGPKFFAYLHHINVHWPYTSPPPFAGMFMKTRPTEDFNSTKFMVRAIEGIRGQSGRAPSAETLRAMSDAYDEGIRHVDSEIGRIMRVLKQRGLYDNTLIVITADHGEEFMEHGLLGHGKALYDESIRVPLVIKFPCPGSRCGPRTVTTQVELVDVFPTVVREVGRTPPASMPGTVLYEEASARKFVFSETAQSIALRTPERKWIYDKQHDSGKLFDLRTDARELNDIAGQQAETARDLTARTLDFTVLYAPEDKYASSAVEADAKMLEGLKALGYVK
jgi:arylsulfatase A-like enzyme